MLLLTCYVRSDLQQQYSTYKPADFHKCRVKNYDRESIYIDLMNQTL